jgi:carbon monoxide dehydrogenase subunit G
VELSHTFTVPVEVPTAWEAFSDIASVAECFPGAVVTSVEGEEFQGTCKVKLGPIALQYAGSGRFLEHDESARRMVIEARGRDKRGNGTAGATVTASFADAGGASTTVEVRTDLQITGKPAQFGRGVIQDVSDKLLGQFVACLEQRVQPAAAAEQAEPEPEPAVQPEPAAAAAQPQPAPAAPAAPAAQAAPVPPPEGDEDALDLGAALLPVLLKSYWRQAAGVLAALVVLRWLVRRRR